MLNIKLNNTNSDSSSIKSIILRFISAKILIKNYKNIIIIYTPYI